MKFKTKFLTTIIFSLLSFGLAYADKTSSTDNEFFNQFPTTNLAVSTTPVKLQFTKNDIYKTQIRDLAKGKANFAGHYVIGIVGTNKELFSAPAMIDLNTGKIFYAPWTIVNPTANVNSRLLITNPTSDKNNILGKIGFTGSCNTIIKNNNAMDDDSLNNDITNNDGRTCKKLPIWANTKYYVWDEQKHQFFAYVDGKLEPYVSANTNETKVVNYTGYWTTTPSQ